MYLSRKSYNNRDKYTACVRIKDILIEKEGHKCPKLSKYRLRIFRCWSIILKKRGTKSLNYQFGGIMEIKRDIYLQKLINRMHNGMIKVITGIRRSGKSYLLFNIFRNYLKTQGVPKNLKQKIWFPWTSNSCNDLYHPVMHTVY